jgi:hypothetical protein
MFQTRIGLPGCFDIASNLSLKRLSRWRNRRTKTTLPWRASSSLSTDTHQLLYSVPFLESYKNIPQTEKDDILDYCQKFNWIAQHCIEKGVLTLYTTGVWFIYRLPSATSSKLIQKFSIDTEDPSTVDYQCQLEHVIKQTVSDNAIQRMNTTQALSWQQSKVVDQIVRQLQSTVLVTKEQRLTEPVVKPTQTGNTTDTAVDNLTKAFEKLSVNLVQQIQSQQQQPPYQRPDSLYRRYLQQLYRNLLTETSGVRSGPGLQDALRNPLSANVGAYRLSQGSGQTQSICWYCYNQNPQYQDLLHRFWEHCLWYQKHLVIGTAYINENGWLAHRYPRPGALEFLIQWNQPEGTQVVIATAGTLEDENIENRPKTQNQTKDPTMPLAGIGSITLLQSMDSKDEEEIETFQTLAAWIKKPQKDET